MMSGNHLGTTSNAQPGFSALNYKMASLNIHGPVLIAEGNLCALNSEMAELNIRGAARTVERSPIEAQEAVTRAKVAISTGPKKARFLPWLNNAQIQKNTQMQQHRRAERKARKKQKRRGKQNEKAQHQVASKNPLGPPALVYLVGPNFTRSSQQSRSALRELPT
jgi:hypothetical protein